MLKFNLPVKKDKPKNNIGINHPLYYKYQPIWHMMQDVIEGEVAVKDACEHYLPKPCGQDIFEYQSYLSRARFPDVVSRTVDGLVGRIFRRPMNIDAPEIIDNMELENTSRKLVQMVAGLGHAGLLIDYDNTNQRPHIMLLSPFQIVNWKQDNYGNLKMVVIEESLQGEEFFSHNTQKMRRVLWLDEDGIYNSQSYLQKDGDWIPQEAVKPVIAGNYITEIPLICVSAYGLGINPEKPMLYGLARANIHYYQTTADRRHGLYLTAQATPYISGGDEIYQAGHDFYGNQTNNETDFTVQIGASRMLILPKGAEVGFAEVSGAGLAEQRAELADLREEMAALGARILRDLSKSNIAAETERMQQGGEASLLSSVARNSSMAIEFALKWCAKWLEKDSSNINVELNTKFFDDPLSPQELHELVVAWQAGAFPKEVLWDRLKKGEIVY